VTIIIQIPSKSFHLFDLLCLKLYGFSIHEYSFSLVWFWFPPLSNLCSKLHQHFLFNAFQQNTCRLWRTGLYPLRDREFNRMRVSNFQNNKLRQKSLFLTLSVGGKKYYYNLLLKDNIKSTRSPRCGVEHCRLST